MVVFLRGQATQEPIFVLDLVPDAPVGIAPELFVRPDRLSLSQSLVEAKQGALRIFLLG